MKWSCLRINKPAFPLHGEEHRVEKGLSSLPADLLQWREGSYAPTVQGYLAHKKTHPPQEHQPCCSESNAWLPVGGYLGS